MKKIDFKDKWVVITGASSGLGREMARYMSEVEGANIILAARREERLIDLKKEIENNTKSKSETITIDLSEEGAGKKLFKSATEKQNIFAIINNAGLTAYERVHSSNMAIYNKIINLNYKTVVESSLLFLEYFKEKNDGGILNIGSVAGFIPIPYQTVYSSSKHAVSGFTLGLIAENKKSPVRITLFSPGGIKTEMVKTSGLEDKFGKNNIFNMDAKKVAKLAIKAFKSGKVNAIPGIMNKIGDIMQRILPRRVIISMFEKSYRYNENK
jgi:short-subunit dehydrogenase